MKKPRQIDHYVQVAFLRISRRGRNKKHSGLQVIGVPSVDAGTYVVQLSSRSVKVERVPQPGESDFVGPLQAS